MKISYKVLFAAILATAGTNAFAADVSGLATTNYVKGAIDSLADVAQTGSYNDLTDKPTFGALATKAAVTSAEITDGTIVNADIAANAAIATSKISGLDTALAGKQATSNIVNPNADGGFAAGDTGSTTKYPSMKAAEQIAAAAAADKVSEVTGRLTSLEKDINDLTQQIEDDKGDLGTLAYKNAVGSAEITDGSVAAADLASNSVTTAKIADKNVTKAKLDDSVQASLGKADSSLQKASGATFTNGHVLKVDASGNVIDGGALGSLATKSAVTSADITDGTIAAADLAANSVTSAKIADDAVTTGKIKGYDTGECSGTNCALVDLGAGAVWLPIVNEYTGN